MKLRFKCKKNIKVLIPIFILFLLVFSYMYMLFNTDFKYVIIDSVNYNFDNRNLDINNLSKSELVYLSLNKITTFDNDIKLEEFEEHFIDIEVKEPLIYIYNTHQTEVYNYKLLDHTVKPTVLFASFILKDYLNDLGIESIVETSSMKEYLTNNKLQYKDSYEASRYYLKNIIEKYPSIKYFIDLHRDSSNIKATLYENDNTRYARVMFVVGMKHSNSSKNLEFVNTFNDNLNSKYKGLSRGILKRDDARFNQDISDKCILIELGGVDNTLEEVNNTLEIISKELSSLIGESSGN